MTFFISLIPDWNSLDAVRRAHSDLELDSIIFFGLLAFFDVLAHRTNDKNLEKTLGGIGLWCFVIAVACEGIGYKYGQRNDELSEGVIRSLSSTSTQAATDSKNAVKDSATAIQQAEKAKLGAATADETAKEAEKTASRADTSAGRTKVEADSIEKQISPRALLQSDRIAIANDLRKFAPNFASRPIKIQSQVGDAEGLLFAIAIGNILDRAGIPSDSTGIGRMMAVGGMQFGTAITGASRDGDFIKAFVGDIQKRSTVGVRGDWKPTFTDCIVFVGVKPIKDMQKLLDVEPK